MPLKYPDVMNIPKLNCLFQILYYTSLILVLFSNQLCAQEGTPELPKEQVESEEANTSIDEVEKEVEASNEGGALDTWIKRTPKKSKIKNEEEEETENAVDDKAMLEEEKKVYEQLIGSYKSSEMSETSINRIFQRGILSKVDQARIEKAKKIQRQVRKEIKDKYKSLRTVKQDEVILNRLCSFDYEVMGLPNEVRKYNPKLYTSSLKAWKNSLATMSVYSCDIILLTGLVSKTQTNAIDFLEKTKSYLDLLSEKKWDYKKSAAPGGGFYGIFFSTEVFNLESFQSIEQVSLRRGGVFKEEKFSIDPFEVIFSLVDAKQKKIRLIAFNYISEKSPFKVIPITYQMQMASALKELIVNRSNSSPDIPIVFMANLKFGPDHPGFHLITNYLGLENFLPDGGCEILEKGEEIKEYYSCDSEKFVPRRRILFGTFTDLYTLQGKVKPQELKRLSVKKRNVKQEIFVLQKDIGKLASKDSEKGPRAGIANFKTNELKSSFIWSDFNFYKE